MSNRNRHQTLALTLASCALLACSGDVVNLGENASELRASGASCALDTSGTVRVQNQEQLNLLAGCERVQGDLLVYPFEGADFTALGSLRVVDGRLELGRFSILDSEFLEGTPTDRAGLDAELALREAGWIGSLQGFEALESVGGLHLLGLGASSLEPLSSLRALTQTGTFELGPCTNLRSLAGLESMTGLRDVAISCNSLESLAALDWPNSLSSLRLEGASVTDLGDFDVTTLNFLGIVGTPLTHLDAFARVTAVQALVLANNDALTNADGLGALGTLSQLGIMDNDLLERLPDFSSVSLLETMDVVSNRSLVALPSFPAIQRVFEENQVGLPEPPGRINLGVDALLVQDNPALTQVVVPLGLPSIRFVQIAGNAALTHVSFSDVTASDFVSINDNPALESIDIGDLQTVDELRVINNPELPLDQLEGVRTFESQLSSEPASDPSSP